MRTSICFNIDILRSWNLLNIVINLLIYLFEVFLTLYILFGYFIFICFTAPVFVRASATFFCLRFWFFFNLFFNLWFILNLFFISQNFSLRLRNARFYLIIFILEHVFNVFHLYIFDVF